MPTISMFFGIIIRMYFAPKEHNPSHIHAYYQDYKTTIKISDGEIIEGQMPVRQLRLIQAWIEIHRDELLADWNLCQNGEKPFQIEPLNDITMYLAVKEVKPLENYNLLLTFENGEKRQFDMSPYLNLEIFQELIDEKMFKTVKINFDTIEWANEADIDPEILYRDSTKVY
jgi:hypothetical protein